MSETKKRIFEVELEKHLNDFSNALDYKKMLVVNDIENQCVYYVFTLPMCRGTIEIKVRDASDNNDELIYSDIGALYLKWKKEGVTNSEFTHNFMKRRLSEISKLEMDESKCICKRVKKDEKEITASINDFLDDLISAEMDLESFRFTKMMKLDWPSSFRTCEDGSEWVPPSDESDGSEELDNGSDNVSTS